MQVHHFTFSPIQENTYVLYTAGGHAAIVDPGCYTDAERQQLKHFLEKKGLSPVLLLQTHAHLDHVFGTKWVAETYNLIPYLHRNEETVLAFAPAAGQMWNLPFDAYNGPCHWVDAGAQLTLGEESLQVLFAPGHSPGHVCFYHAADGFVVGGDVLFQGSIGRTDLPGGNFEVLISSIREQLFTLPDDTKVFPGHGPATTIGAERLYNPFLQS